MEPSIYVNLLFDLIYATESLYFDYNIHSFLQQAEPGLLRHPKA